ncbi:hypothetical protein EYF80_053574 [Liparis tanakae]|uniref:Uncharacterized protein n=1 Tax=Liparis tanakae TaxID=230148 RepID=A0A4Z2F532_9TELE|nr:hypothetical protein EYF80_053574 [Liparis tanakae]
MKSSPLHHVHLTRLRKCPKYHRDSLGPPGLFEPKGLFGPTRTLWTHQDSVDPPGLCGPTRTLWTHQDSVDPLPSPNEAAECRPQSAGRGAQGSTMSTCSRLLLSNVTLEFPETFTDSIRTLSRGSDTLERATEKDVVGRIRPTDLSSGAPSPSLLSAADGGTQSEDLTRLRRGDLEVELLRFDPP